MPIMELLKRNPTMFSEESREVGLTALSSLTPTSDRGDIEQTLSNDKSLSSSMNNSTHVTRTITSKVSHLDLLCEHQRLICACFLVDVDDGKLVEHFKGSIAAISEN